MSFAASPGRRAWAALGLAAGLALCLSLGVSPALSQDDNGEPLPTLSIADAAAEEGEDLVFTATLSPSSNQAVTVAYYTVDASATAGEDYVEIYEDTLTIGPGDTTGTITVSGVEDSTDEPDETIEVWLYDLAGAAFAEGSDTVTGTISDDDVPALTISASEPVDEDAAGAALTFTVSLSIASYQEFEVDYATGGGTAEAGVDYTTASDSLTFEIGDTMKTVSVTVTNDTLDEDDETVTVNLNNVSVEGVDLTGAEADGTIRDDDPLPTLSVATATAQEGNDLVFTATLNPASGRTVTVSYVTADGSATSGEDYAAIDDGALTIGPGDTAGVITVSGLQDGVDEPDETFEVWLRDLAGATFAEGSDTVAGTITDDDVPALTISASEPVDEDSSGATLTFTVSLSIASHQEFEVDYATGGGTAEADVDYTALSDSLTFGEEDTTKTVSVSVMGDTLDEDDEIVTVTLSNVSVEGIDLTRAQADGTIRDDDPLPTLSIGDSMVEEPDEGETSSLTFTITLTLASGRTVKVDYDYLGVGEHPATLDGDYEAVSPPTLAFSPGETSKTVTVSVIGDDLLEYDEGLIIRLRDPVNATIARGDGVGTITDDDPLPTLSVADATAEEGEDLVFTATLSPASSRTVTVNYVTADAIATAGEDYEAIDEGALTIEPGDTTGAITVSGLDDSVDEPDETFEVWLSDPVDVALAEGSGTVTGTITDDDDPPIMSISDAKVREATSGTTTLRFSVTLTPQSGKEVTVNYDTSVGEGAHPATVGDDFIASNGTLRFEPGDLMAYVDVTVIADRVVESDETLILTLRNPRNASFALGAPTIIGTGTIADKPPAPPRPPRRPTRTPRQSVAEVPPPQTAADQVAPGIVEVKYDPATGEYTLVAVAAGDTQAEVRVAGQLKIIKVSLKSDETLGTQITIPGAPGVLGNVDRIEIEAVETIPEDADGDQSAASQRGGVDWNRPLYGFRIAGGRTIIDITLYDARGDPITRMDIPLRVCLPAGTAAVSPADRSHLKVLRYDADEGWNPLTNPQVTTTPMGEIMACGDSSRFSFFAVGYVLSIEAAPTAVRVSEGGNASYLVALTGPPTQAVTVTPASNDPEVATVGGPLVFRPDNWDTPQRIAVTGVTDDDAVVESVTVTHVAAGGDYDGVTGADVIVDVTESQHAGLAVTPKAAALLEGNIVSYSVALTSEPTGRVMVKLEPQGAGVILTPATLAFTPRDWRAPQKVVLTAMRDNDSDDKTVVLTLKASGADYNGVVSTVKAEVSDAQAPTPAPTPGPMPTPSPTQGPVPDSGPTPAPDSTPGPALTLESEPTPGPTATPMAVWQPPPTRRSSTGMTQPLALEPEPTPEAPKPPTVSVEPPPNTPANLNAVPSPDPVVPTATEPVRPQDGGGSPAWVVALAAAVVAGAGVLGILIFTRRPHGGDFG